MTKNSKYKPLVVNYPIVGFEIKFPQLRSIPNKT